MTVQISPVARRCSSMAEQVHGKHQTKVRNLPVARQACRVNGQVPVHARPPQGKMPLTVDIPGWAIASLRGLTVTIAACHAADTGSIPVGDSVQHGTRSSYVRGCRCNDCRAASSAYERTRIQKRRIHIQPMSEAEVGWLAGLLEGEGYFGITKSAGSNKLRCVVRVSMTDKDVLQKAQQLTGVGTIIQHRPRVEHHKIAYTWSVSKQFQVREVLELIHPFMGTRRTERINECLAILKTWI